MTPPHPRVQNALESTVSTRPAQAPSTRPEGSPRVSVGLPVYNGQPYVEAAIRSLLAQTFHDFELIVSDNASTDGTERICRRLAEADRRIRYVRQPRNLGAMANFNRVVELARGEYFKWAAHDDVHEPPYLERCVEILDRDPDVVLVFPRLRDVDADGREIGRRGLDLEVDADDVARRFAELTRLDFKCEVIFGLMRTAVLRSTRLLGDYADCDRVLLAELGLRGRFRQIDEPLFVHRQHADRSVARYTTRQTRSAWFNPARGGRPAFPYTRELIDFWRAVQGAPGLSRRERSRCRRIVMRRVLQYRRGVGEDVVFALRWALRPLRGHARADLFRPRGEGKS